MNLFNDSFSMGVYQTRSKAEKSQENSHVLLSPSTIVQETFMFADINKKKPEITEMINDNYSSQKISHN